MKTLGIDLSSQSTNTAACLIDWSGESPVVLGVRTKLSDDSILALISEFTLDLGLDAVGIDAPFGWPQPFIEFIGREPKGTRSSQWTAEYARTLTYRLTDVRVKETLSAKPGKPLTPLSVAADKIAYTAFRCSGLLDDLGVYDRSGVNGVFEVYPAASLKAWDLPFSEYKGSSLVVKERLAAMLTMVCQRCKWLDWANWSNHGLCSQSDHAFDALIASLMARAAMLGQTIQPTPDERARVSFEGWIACPESKLESLHLSLDGPPVKNHA
jgi:hypothetical protein